MPSGPTSTAWTGRDWSRLGDHVAENVERNGATVGLPVNGRRVAFTENVFYRSADGRIETV